MDLKSRASKIVAALTKQYPDAICSLEHNRLKPYQLLIAVRLAAQCTDARVNIVTNVLFKKYGSLEEIASCDIDELSEIVRPCGFYKVKARNIRETAGIIISRFGGVVPSDMDELLSLPGVGRKSANLIRGDIYGLPAIVTDTHCIRISNRLGLADSDDPAKVEVQLIPLIEPKESNDFCHRLVLFGREFCTARAPRCGDCPLASLCPSKKDEKKK